MCPGTSSNKMTYTAPHVADVAYHKLLPVRDRLRFALVHVASHEPKRAKANRERLAVPRCRASSQRQQEPPANLRSTQSYLRLGC